MDTEDFYGSFYRHGCGRETSLIYKAFWRLDEPLVSQKQAKSPLSYKQEENVFFQTNQISAIVWEREKHILNPANTTTAHNHHNSQPSLIHWTSTVLHREQLTYFLGQANIRSALDCSQDASGSSKHPFTSQLKSSLSKLAPSSQFSKLFI